METVRHLSDETLMDALESAAGGAVAEHLAACPACTARLEEARIGLELTREAAVPEPPGIYWQSFPRQVARRIDAAPAARAWPAWTAGTWIARGLAATVAVGGALVFLAMPGQRREPSPAPTTAAQTLPAWSPLPAAEEDPGLPVLQALGPAVIPAVECSGVADCLADLSDEESQDLVDSLRASVKETVL